MMLRELDLFFEKPPALIVEYRDPDSGFSGWFVRDSLDNSICAGGIRVQPGLSREHLCSMARNMSLKMRICELGVDGAKCGIDFDPSSPDKEKAVGRFLRAIRPYVETVYSMGPDLNVEMEELERIGRNQGISSVKMAVARAQGWDLSYYKERAAILNQKVGGWSLGRLRAGHGVAAAALALLGYMKISPPGATVVIQGFGTLAKAAALGLHRAGVRVTGVADREKSLVAAPGKLLDIESLVVLPGPLLPAKVDGGIIGGREDLFDLNCDILIPAAIERTVDGENAHRLQVRAVVPGANLGVSREAEDILWQRGIVVLPDFLAGCGGSLSMEGVFGPTDHPGAAQVLTHVESRMARLVNEVLTRSVADKIPPTVAGLRICLERKTNTDSRPYGSQS